MRVEILSDDPERFAPGAVLHPEGSDEPLTIVWAQRDGPGLLVRFAEVPDRPASEAYRDRYLEADVDRDELPPGTFFWHEIEGLPVTTTDGRALGTVREIFRAGGSEVYVVRGGSHGEVMIPAVSAVIRELDPAAGRMVVDADALGLDEEVVPPKPRGRRSVNAARRGEAPPGAQTAGEPPQPADPASAADGAGEPGGA